MGDYDGLAVLVGLGIVVIQILYVFFLSVICCWAYALIVYLWGIVVDWFDLDVAHGGVKNTAMFGSTSNVYCRGTPPLTSQ